MSTAATMQQTPAVPPRPARNSGDSAASGSMPKVPPRPASKRDDRSISPNPARFAQSPFTEGIIAKPPKGSTRSPFYGSGQQRDDPIERAGSVGMPSVGEEGVEYDNVAGELEYEQLTKRRSLSPEQTRMIGEDIKLHAPKPSLPAMSAKQRVQAVTRTDSDRAAQYGLGRPSSRTGSFHEERAERTSSTQGIKKKPSSSFSAHSDTGNGTDEDHGIPEFGQRVPMNPYLGDVQAPSPAPGSDSPGRYHHRKGSSRSLPPGSYGLHGHGVAPQDKLEKAYYQKHPELLEKEQHNAIHERQNDFSMSSSDLNKLVRDTANRGHGITPEYRSTPTDEVAFQASQEYASRMSPRPTSAAAKDNSVTSPLKQSFHPDPSAPLDDKPIHVDDARHPEYRSYGDEDTAIDDEEHEYTAPILASDEVQKDPNAYLQRPAVHPHADRRGSSYENEDPPSRPTSRPTSLYNTVSHEFHSSTPLEDVEEYEPLFSEEEAKAKEIQKKKAEARNRQHHFPSKDIWEDAPSSVHFTAEVSTPDIPETSEITRRRSSALEERSQTPAHVFAQQQEEIAEREALAGRPEDWNIRDEEKKHRADRSDSRSPLQHRTSGARISTPAKAFAQRQEELAEKEANHGIRPEDWSARGGPSWREAKPHVATHRTGGSGRFPSRDVWEDTPESAMYQTTVSASPPKEAEKPDIPARPVKKLSGSSADRPAVPDRPKPRQGSGDDAAKVRPPVSDRPKPQVPARPTKSTSGDSTEAAAAKPKPPVPSRPVGGKIAALQAGFMNDLNQRLRVGPQISTKKEEPEEPAPEQEKAPLSDARKSRARGPQRRAPAKSPAPEAKAPAQSVPTFTFTMAESSWSIDPEEGNVSVVNALDEKPVPETKPAEAPVEDAPASEEPQAPQSQVEAAEQAAPVETKPPAEQPVAEEPAASEEPAEVAPVSEAPKAEEPPKEMKTLVANTAGESILETEVEKKSGDEVEPVAVEDTPKDL